MISYSHPVSLDDDVEDDAADAVRSRTISRETLVKLSTTVEVGDVMAVNARARARRRAERVNDDGNEGYIACESARERPLEAMRRDVPHASSKP
jgi:hypothetical protein